MKKLLLVMSAALALGLVACQDGITGGGEDPVPVKKTDDGYPGFEGIVYEAGIDPPPVPYAYVRIWCRDCAGGRYINADDTADQDGYYDCTSGIAYKGHTGCSLEVHAFKSGFYDYYCGQDHACPTETEWHDIYMWRIL